FTGAYLFAGVTYNSEDGTVIVAVLDCAGHAIEGAKITADPAPAKIVYADADGLPSTSQTSTGGRGLVYLMGANPGTITVSGTSEGRALKPTSFKARANVLTVSFMHP